MKAKNVDGKIYVSVSAMLVYTRQKNIAQE